MSGFAVQPLILRSLSMAYPEPSLSVRRVVRKAAGSHATCPVVVVDGRWRPKVKGDGWHYETMGGRIIHHPSAYKKRGWSNMRYIGSTVRVEVGVGWLIRHCPDYCVDVVLSVT